MGANEAGGSVKSALRTLDVLEMLVSQSRPMAAGEIAAALAIPMSSLSYLLATLVDRGYIARSGRLYTTGSAMARLRPRAQAPTLADLVGPIVLKIRNELNETTSFFVRRGFEIEAVASEVGRHALQYTVAVGQRAPMHSFAAGKALLATLADEEFQTYLATGHREKFTANTVVDRHALQAEIESIRREGVARTREEHTAGIVGIGRAAIGNGGAMGAFSIAVPAARYDDDIDAKAVRLLDRAVGRLARLQADPIED